MNRESDFDQLLTSWLDEGADVAPERFVWAALEDVERSAQRGAWRTSLEGIFMSLKPAAPILGVAAIAVAALALYVALANPNVGTSDPTPRAITSDELPAIILTEGNAPDGMTVDATTRGYEALTTPLRPGGEIIPLTGFDDALMTNLNSTVAGGYVTWSALYETTFEADLAFDFLVAEHESDEGWGLVPSSPDPELGDESALYSGAAYQFDAARIYLWRVNNLLLAAVFVDVTAVDDANAERLRVVAEAMDDRAH
jgi:hypothetical protein